MNTVEVLSELSIEHQMLGKGFLGLALVITDEARTKGLPLDPAAMMTKGGGQVKGAGGARVGRILADHGITRRLSSEGGRTSRGTPAKMRAYVGFLNGSHDNSDFDLGAIMDFWIARVRDFFASKPFVLEADPALGVSGLIRALVQKVEERQRETVGATLVGTVIQHLIGAKIEVALGLEVGQVARHGASVNDVTGRGGDLEFGDTVIHVTTAPGQPVVEKCRANLMASQRPVIVTGRNRVSTAEALISDQSLGGRIDVLDYEQFLAANVFELGRFSADGRKDAIARIIARYNEIIARLETDPSLRIEVH
jgi:hypothetical protein